MRIRIDLKIFIFIIVFYFTKQIELYALLMIFALLHELGHLIAGLILGFIPERISIMPMGLSVEFKVPIEYYNKKIVNSNLLSIKKIIIASAGPMVNLLIALCFIFMNFGLDEIKRLDIVYSNLIIFIFNLIPIYPLDGGRILKQIIKIKKGVVKSIEIVHSVQNATIIILTAISSIAIYYFKNIAIFFIITYLWILFIRENKVYKLLKKI